MQERHWPGQARGGWAHVHSCVQDHNENETYTLSQRCYISRKNESKCSPSNKLLSTVYLGVYTVQQLPSRSLHLPMVTTVHSHCPVLCGLCWAVVMENIKSLHSASVNTWIIGSGFSLLLTFNVFIEMTSQLLSTGWKIIHLYKLQHNFTLHPSSSVDVMFYYYAFLYIRLYKKMSECLVIGLPLAAL